LNISIPEIQKPFDSPQDFLWFCPIKNTNGVYIKFEDYPSFEEMEVFGERVLSSINERQIKQLVIDLRNNGGGDFFVGTRLAYHLNLANSIDWKSGVYILTDKVTFSAATTNATQFRQMLNAKVVGEPTGSNPTGYQDMGTFELPNSGLVISYSKRKFRFQELANQGLQPDVLMEYDWESFSKGRDNMMEWVIRDMREKVYN
jgi:C-terminal processing protease CtpA/Prc